jgi:hypothetical protein
MVRNPQTIVLNGKRYDALTGEPIGVNSNLQNVASKPLVNPVTVIQPTKPRFIDGIIGSRNDLPSRTQLKPVAKPIQATPAPKSSHSLHIKAPDIKREPAKSKTLMRAPLTKPKISLNSHIIQPIRRSNYVSRVSGIVHQPIAINNIRDSIKLTTEQIKSSPVGNKISEIKDRANEAINNLTIDSPILSNDLDRRNIEQIKASLDDNAFKNAASNIVDKTATKKSRKARIRNDSHFNRTTLNVVIGIIILVIIALFSGLVFENNLKMSFADFKTGMSGSYPKYMPLGYSLDKFEYYKNGITGSIDLQYRPAHNTLNNYLTIDETTTSLDNSGLLAASVDPAVGNNYQSISLDGLTIYYFQNHYAWVNAGIEYSLIDGTGLTQPTILKIISSI